MRANDYEPVVRALAAEGVPVAAELIWGLPGDSFDAFEANLDQLMRVFPNFNIFGYTLLPGTEFFDRRDEYRIEALPVAGYGKARGEYVVGCHSFTRDEGEEGYFLITACVVLVRGQILPLTARFLALDGRLRVGRLLHGVLHDLAVELARGFPDIPANRMATYEQRATFYVRLIAEFNANVCCCWTQCCNPRRRCSPRSGRFGVEGPRAGPCPLPAHRLDAMRDARLLFCCRARAERARMYAQAGGTRLRRNRTRHIGARASGRCRRGATRSRRR
jgi:hypothetical protein